MESFAESADQKVQLNSLTIEHASVGLVDWFRDELTRLGVSCELMVMFSLLNAKRSVLNFRRDDFMLDDDEGYFIRQHVVLPEVVLAESDETAPGMQRVFDLLWQASNMERSRFFNDVGQLVQPR